MNYDEVLAYYSKPQVKDEIATYCGGKWVALEGLERGGGRAFLRYTRSGVPMTINDPEDVNLLLKKFRFFKPRTIYASVNSYRKLENRENTEDPENISWSTPVWDVDASLDSWEYAVRASEIIVNYLDKEKVSRSVYLKWSGRGIHIHIHEKAFSKKLLKRYNPLDVAFSIVEYVQRKTKNHLIKVAADAPRTGDRLLRVENKMDIKRVFTAPLSLHRLFDFCCVCFKQNDIYNFNPEWAKAGKYRHDPSWKFYEEGEGDSLAEKALAEIGGYDGWSRISRERRRRTYVAADKASTEKTALKKLGRFQVMGLLQAARYFLIKGDIKRAKSFGLNRAIFYAWAKRYARDRLTRSGRKAKPSVRIHAEKIKVERLGNETAYLSPKGWFMIGGTEQSAGNYEQQIVKRIEDANINYEDAWTTALRYLKRFPKDILLDQQRFYNEVYKPVRDSFHMMIKQGSKIGGQQTLD